MDNYEEINIFGDAIIFDYSTPILENYNEYYKISHVTLNIFQEIIQKFLKDVKHFEIYFFNKVMNSIYNKKNVYGYVYFNEKKIKESYNVICAKKFVNLAIDYIFKTRKNCCNIYYRVLINLSNGKFKSNLTDDESYVKVYINLKPYPDTYSLKKDKKKFQYLKI